jgi:hypothetical protein
VRPELLYLLSPTVAAVTPSAPKQYDYRNDHHCAGLGYGTEEIVAIIQTMEKRQLYKSMTSNYDSKVRPDVYHVPHPAGILYGKFTDNGLLTEFTLLSFKEK